MKKFICLLTLVTMLLITSMGALAATPQSSYSDVPAKHWAYDAVAKLAKDGIINGYGDGTFRGDRTMTRYEMAQIVANAMTKEDKANAEDKALINKLAAEFNNELAKLDARVTAVEKKQGNLTLSGSAYERWVRWDNAPEGSPWRKGMFQNHYQLNAIGNVNDDVTGTLRLYMMRNNTFGDPATANASPDSNEPNNVIEAKFEFRNVFGDKGTTATLGRFPQYFGATNYIGALVGLDGAKIDFGNKLKVTLGAADFGNALSSFTKNETFANGIVSGALYFKDAAFAKLVYNTSPATQVQGFYLKNTSGDKVANMYGIGFASTVAPNLVFKADYAKNTAFDSLNTNRQFVLAYRAADVSRPGTWGVVVNYSIADARANFGWGDYNPITMWPMADEKAWNAKVEYAFMKNVQLRIAQSFNSKVAETGAKAPYGEFSRVEVDYFF